MTRLATESATQPAKRVAFVCDGFAFTGEDLRTQALGGIESATILLSEAMVQLGVEVVVFNDLTAAAEYAGVQYRPLNEVLGSARQGVCVADLLIVSNSARMLRWVRGCTNVVWQHNRTRFSRAVKRGELRQLLRWRPSLVVLSGDAARNTSRWLPYGEKHIIPHAAEAAFIRSQPLTAPPPGQLAFFASRPSRNLDFVVDVWQRWIHPALPAAELHICTSGQLPASMDAQALLAQGIVCRGRLDKQSLQALVWSSRALLYPGHESETGCQVAIQAIASGVPIVTSGIGCLKDQVVPGVTGYIESDPQAYAEKAIACLRGDQWLALHQASLRSPWVKTIASAARDWLTAFRLIDA